MRSLSGRAVLSFAALALLGASMLPVQVSACPADSTRTKPCCCGPEAPQAARPCCCPEPAGQPPGSPCAVEKPSPAATLPSGGQPPSPSQAVAPCASAQAVWAHVGSRTVAFLRPQPGWDPGGRGLLIPLRL